MLDILAFGAHPDDVEIGIGGTLALHGAKGYRMGIVDLTRGEMSSNGTVAEREAEGKEAARVLGVEVRVSTGLPDAYLRATEEALQKVAEVVRRYRPRTVLLPFPRDRHPDHGHAGELVREACHLAGLKRYPAAGEPYRPLHLYYYFLAKTEDPPLIVDISEYAPRKWQAIACHKSQFSLRAEEQYQTLVNSPVFARFIRGRDQFFGALIGAQYGEGLVPERKVAVYDLLRLGGIEL
jgi:N-acetylglucosamine malate deacetylase 1